MSLLNLFSLYYSCKNGVSTLLLGNSTVFASLSFYAYQPYTD